MRNHEGFATQRSSYDRQGRCIERAFYGPDDKPTLCKNGYSKVTKKYDDRGNPVCESFYGLDGNLIPDSEGVAIVRYEYDHKGRAIREFYCAVDGTPYPNTHGIASITYDYDARSRVIRESLFGPDNMPCMHPDGYSVIIREYDETHWTDSGGCIQINSFLNSEGIPCNKREGHSKEHITYNGLGEQLGVKFISPEDIDNDFLAEKNMVVPPSAEADRPPLIPSGEPVYATP